MPAIMRTSTGRGLPLLKGALAEDMRSLEALCLGKSHSCLK